MTDSRHTPDPDDVLLQHMRQHSTGEPPASLDAFILNAARREAPKPAPNLWQRWLRACQQPRWQMAFASLAGVALLVGVITRTPELDPVHNTRLAAPAAFSAPAPMSAPPRAESYSAEMSSDALPQANMAKRQLDTFWRRRVAGAGCHARPTRAASLSFLRSSLGSMAIAQAYIAHRNPVLW